VIGREGGFCATLFQTARNSLILNGEMSEGLKEHAWKLNPLARADAHQIAPTHSRSATSRNNDVHWCIPVNRGVDPGFRGVCDTVLTQFGFALSLTHTEQYGAVPRRETRADLPHLTGSPGGRVEHRYPRTAVAGLAWTCVGSFAPFVLELPLMLLGVVLGVYSMIGRKAPPG
jgi:hypothetical protein